MLVKGATGKSMIWINIDDEPITTTITAAMWSDPTLRVNFIFETRIYIFV